MFFFSLSELGQGRVGREELFITLPVACSVLLGLTNSVLVTFPGLRPRWATLTSWKGPVQTAQGCLTLG